MSSSLESIKSIPMRTILKNLGIKIYNNKISCPFHGSDSTPSLQIYDRTNTWYCWGCNKSGDNIKFIEYYYQCLFAEAKERLGVSSQSINHNFQINYSPPNFRKSRNVDKTYRYLFENINLTNLGYEYLVKHRKLNKNLLTKYNIKSIDNPNEIAIKLNDKFGTKRLLNDGLMSVSTNTGRIYFTFFLQSVIFPHIRNDKYVYAISRSYEGKNYFKPPSIPARVFMPNPFARKLVIVESIICGLSYEMLTGKDNFIAISSANIQFLRKILSSFDTRNITLMLDNDDVTQPIYQKLKAEGYKFSVLNPQEFAKDFKIYNKVKDINDIVSLLN